MCIGIGHMYVCMHVCYNIYLNIHIACIRCTYQIKSPLFPHTRITMNRLLSHHVLGMLGVTPIAQEYFMREYHMSSAYAGLLASIIGEIL